MPKVCMVEGCKSKHHAKGYCGKHYAQLLRCGHIKERTTFDKNNFSIYDNYAEMYIYNVDSEIIAVVKIDIDDIEKIKKYKWCLSSYGYPISCINGRNISLHRFLLNPNDDRVVDHINGDTLDNRRSNLRICTQQENSMNKKMNSNNTSGVKGVYWCKNANKWRAKIQVDGKEKHLGLFSNLEDAKKARELAEEKYYGEYNRK